MVTVAAAHARHPAAHGIWRLTALHNHGMAWQRWIHSCRYNEVEQRYCQAGEENDDCLSCYSADQYNNFTLGPIGTEFMDRLGFWLEAVPGSSCVRAGAGAYADALLPSTCPCALPCKKIPRAALARGGGGLTLSSALATVVAPLFFFFPGRARQITSPTPSRRHTSARTTPLSRRKPSTSTVHIGREGGGRGEVGWWELSDAMVGRPVHVYVGRSGR